MNNHDVFLQRKFKKTTSLIPSNSKILDIGCNDGKIRKFLKNCDYYGIDLNKEEINKLKKQGIKAKQIDLNKSDIPFGSEKFDYILLLDILEHINDPKDLLQKIKKRLKQDGKVVITLPNDYHILNKIRFIFNKHLTSDPFSPCGHLHFFPIKTGETLLLKQGFKILKKYPLSPIKPSFIPQLIKDFLTRIFPQSFARDILYLLSVQQSFFI